MSGLKSIRATKIGAIAVLIVCMVATLGCASRPGGASFAPSFMAALNETEGCLGVDAGRTMSGKSVIFAWFEDKQAALRWYHSQAHRDAMETSFPARPTPAVSRSRQFPMECRCL